VGLSMKKRSFQPMTAADHQWVQFGGRKRACVGCKQQGRLSKDGQGKWVMEITYGCDTCGANFCLDFRCISPLALHKQTTTWNCSHKSTILNYLATDKPTFLFT
jgi:hypothetical protein